MKLHVYAVTNCSSLPLYVLLSLTASLLFTFPLKIQKLSAEDASTSILVYPCFTQSTSPSIYTFYCREISYASLHRTLCTDTSGILHHRNPEKYKYSYFSGRVIKGFFQSVLRIRSFWVTRIREKNGSGSLIHKKTHVI